METRGPFRGPSFAEPVIRLRPAPPITAVGQRFSRASRRLARLTDERPFVKRRARGRRERASMSLIAETFWARNGVPRLG